MKALHIRLIGIPLVSLLVSLLFFLDTCPLFSLQFFLGLFICFCITAVLWLGNEAIFEYFHAKMPHVNETFKRTHLIALSSVAYSVVGYLLTKLLLVKLLPLSHMSSNFWFDLKICLLFTCLVVLFYEASYFLKQWRLALVEGEKLRKETVQAQLDGLRNQINPHFLFNSLNTLVSIIPESPHTATDFVHKLSHVYRYLLCMKDKELVALQTELDFIASYLFLLKVRFEENIKIEIQISEGAEVMLLPPVSLQLLIENAIKHNVVSAEKPLHIHIFTEKGHLVVRNNLEPRQQLEESTGVGLQNIQTRYGILSTQHIVVMKSEHHFTVSLPLL